MCGNTQSSSRREYPHNIPSNHRRFKNGVWQKPTSKGRGWQNSLGLAGMTYQQGLDFLIELNRTRVIPFIDVTTPDQMPVEHAAASDLPTNRNHRRFNTVTQQWEKPNSTMTGWKPSGIAFYSLEAGNEYFVRATAAGHSYINIGAVTPGQPVVEQQPAEQSVALVPQADVNAFENFLEEGNPAAGFGEFGAPFSPVLTVLANGGMTLTVDALGAVGVARALVISMTGLPGTQRDKEVVAPIIAALRQDNTEFGGETLYEAAVGTLARGE